MIRKSGADRRKVNVAVGDERRGKATNDRRRCPKCKASLQQSIESYDGGTWTLIFCTKCDYQARTKQMDEERIHDLLGFEGMIVGTTKKPLLELSPDFMKHAGLKPGDSLELKPLYTPGSKAGMSWVIKKAE